MSAADQGHAIVYRSALNPKIKRNNERDLIERILRHLGRWEPPCPGGPRPGSPQRGIRQGRQRSPACLPAGASAQAG